MKIILSKTEYELDELSRDELLQLKGEASEIRDNIKESLERAKMGWTVNREEYDVDWYYKAQHALRKTNKAILAIDSEIPKRQRPTKPQPVRPLAEMFMDVCREELGEAAFRRLLKKAQERSG